METGCRVCGRAGHRDGECTEANFSETQKEQEKVPSVVEFITEKQEVLVDAKDMPGADKEAWLAHLPPNIDGPTGKMILSLIEGSVFRPKPGDKIFDFASGRNGFDWMTIYDPEAHQVTRCCIADLTTQIAPEYMPVMDDGERLKDILQENGYLCQS